MNQQRKVLIVLFGLLLLAICYAYWMTPEQLRQAPQSAGEQPRSGSVTQEGLRQPSKNTLRVDLLEKVATRYQTPKRDIFNFATIKKKPIAKSKPKPPVVKPEVKPRPTPVVTTVVRQQLSRFTFLGFLIKDDLHTVFLSRGEDLFLVQENDQFGDDKQFTAISISPEVMRIRQSGDTRNIDIQLIEKEPLIPTMQQLDVPNVKPQAPSVQNMWPKSKVPNIKR